MEKTVQRKEILEYCDTLLMPEAFKDYAPNGLQVEGANHVSKIVTGVTASQALIDAAIDEEAEMILVHHGYFWGNEDPRVVGMKQKRLKALLQNNISLLAYHLPLDAHKEFGNNVELAKRLNIDVEGCAGKMDLIFYGSFAAPKSVKALQSEIATKLHRQPLVLGPDSKEIRTIAWCTGAAQGYLMDAVALGVDAFISGEVSEQTKHIAEENNIVYLSAGHHATERYGIQALGERVASEFGIAHHFVDIDNPI